MRLLRIVPVILAAVVIGAGLVACGDDDDDTGGDGSPAATESPAAATSPGTDGNDETPPATGADNVVDVKTENFAFDPAEITVPAGEPVTFRFTNADSVSHTFTLYTDEEFENPIGGGSATEQEPEITVSFVDPGEYYFRCELHPSQMQGELKAQ
jgi:plastocyanin